MEISYPEMENTDIDSEFWFKFPDILTFILKQASILLWHPDIPSGVHKVGPTFL